MAWRSAFRVWHRDRCLGVVWKSALGHGFAVGCVGSDRRGFLWVVVSMGFGGWNGGGYCDWVMVGSRCRGGFAWWWLSFFTGWATVSWISLEIGGVVVAIGSIVEVGLVCWWQREVMHRESYLKVGLIDIWFLQVVFYFWRSV